MWFGTEDGLHKYDGYSFTIYRHDPSDPSSLSDNKVTAIYEDRSGVFWIGVGDGLNKFDPHAEKFTRYLHHLHTLTSLTVDYISAIHEDRFDNLWIGTAEGLYRLIPSTGPGWALSPAVSGVEGEIEGFDPDRVKFIRYRHDPQNPNSISDNRVYSIYEVHDSVENVIWVGTAVGLNKFYPSQERFIRYFHDPQDPMSLSHNDVRSIYESKSGGLWIGTYGDGLNKLVPIKRKQKSAS